MGKETACYIFLSHFQQKHEMALVHSFTGNKKCKSTPIKQRNEKRDEHNIENKKENAVKCVNIRMSVWFWGEKKKVFAKNIPSKPQFC